MGKFTKTVSTLLAIMLISVWVYGQSGKADVILYDNGPFVTHVGVGSNGSDYSSTQGAIPTPGESMNWNGPTNTSVADDFVVDANWTISSFTFQGYQTGSGTTSTMTEIRMQIWDGDPRVAGSTVIWGDIAANNLLLSTTWTNCYRVMQIVSEDRPIMEMVANTGGLVLTPGTYWVQYSAAGSSAYSGPWANFVSILGQYDTGNSIQKQGSAWGTNDCVGHGQDLPFYITGTTAPLAAKDLSVVSVLSPISGMVLGNETVKVKIINKGTEAQTGFELSYTINGGAPVTETVSATIDPYKTYDYTFTTLADLSAVGTYTIEACVTLTGDENNDNNCSSKTAECFSLNYCDASTGGKDEYISRVVCSDLDNSSEWQIGVADYTNLHASIGPGIPEAITVTNGKPYGTDRVTVWVDWNDDFVFELGGNEEFVLANNGTGSFFTGKITPPASATYGMHRMRIRLAYNAVPSPCGYASFGEIEDYNVLIADPTYGNLTGTVTAEGGAAIEGAAVILNDTTSTTTAVDGTYSFNNIRTGPKTVTATAAGYHKATGTAVVKDGETTALDIKLSLVLFSNLEGTVTVVGGAALEGATVRVAGMAYTTAADGKYSFTDIEIGNYDVTAVATGYSFEYQKDFLFEEGKTHTINFELTKTGTIPKNFSATVVDITDIRLSWDPPAGALTELTQHDNIAKKIFSQQLTIGYGVVYNLSAYPGATIESLDFYHLSQGITGIWDYKIHIVDWDSGIELTELGPFQTTGNDAWEQEVYLGSYPVGLAGNIAVIMEPLSKSGTVAYPLMPIDASRSGNSVFGPLVDYSIWGVAGGDFLMDLWIISPNGKKMVKPEKISVNNLTSDKALNDYVTLEETELTANPKASGSKGFIGYNVYRNDALIAENLGTVSYLDTNLLAGTYRYDVKTVYDEGLSDGAGPLTVSVVTGVDRDLVIMELGTGTWCVFCPGAAMGVDQMHEEGLSVGIIEYHNDDTYATDEGGDRLAYYNVSSFPTTMFDGLYPHSGGNATNSLYGSFLPKYEGRLNVPSLFTLASTYQNTGGENYRVTVDAEMIFEYSKLSNDIVLHVVLTESHIDEAWQNQEELNFVCRDMIPDNNGTTLNFAGNAIQSKVLDFTIPADYNMANIELIVFIQDKNTKEILQGTIAQLTVAGLNAPANLAGPTEVNVNTDFDITWDRPDTGDNNLTGYNVYRKLGDAAYEIIATVTETSYTDNVPTIGNYNYYVTAVYNEGESAKSNDFSIDIVTSIEAYLLNKSIQLYPNPTTDVVNILAEADIISITVYNNFGQVVFTKSVNSNSYKLNTTNFTKGLCLIQLKTEKGIVSKQVVIE